MVDHRRKSEPQIEREEDARVRFTDEVECWNSPQGGDTSHDRRTIKPQALIEPNDYGPAITSENNHVSIKNGPYTPNLEDITASGASTTGAQEMGSSGNYGSASLENEFDACYR